MNLNTSQTVLITGAARRIGRALALGLAGDGWTVAVHYNTSADNADEVVDAINSDGGRAVAVQADLSDEAQTGSLLSRTVELIGPLTCLINNASVFEEDNVTSADKASWDAHMQTNLRAPFVLAQAFAAQHPDGAAGNIINIIDQRVWNLTPHFVSYTLSKAGLWTLTQTLGMALAPDIRVNAIGPGPALPSARQTEKSFAEQCATLPLGRAVNPDEIVDAVRYILGAPSMTAQMIALDGGQHLGWAQASVDTVPEE
ncbi:MAG: SDR family oxidoreductase [Alphaproteobacteria bacterium]